LKIDYFRPTASVNTPILKQLKTFRTLLVQNIYYLLINALFYCIIKILHTLTQGIKPIINPIVMELYAPITNPPFNEPILRPQWAMTAWLGNANYEFYSVFATHMYTSFGQVQTSDRRLKTNIRVWNGSALNKVMRLNIYRYDMNPAKFNNVPEEKMEQVTEEAKNKIGFIAQELQEEFPEMVSIIPGTDYLGVDYSMMIPILLEAIKEQQAFILELQARVLELEKR
jgi:hypothetical protein